jgi:hypothetical protein
VVVKSLATAGTVKALGIGAALGVLAMGTLPAARWVTKAEPATSSARALPPARAEVSANGRAKLQQRTAVAPGAPEAPVSTSTPLPAVPTELAANVVGEVPATPASHEPAHAVMRAPTPAPVAGDAAARARAIEPGAPGIEAKVDGVGLVAPASTFALDLPPSVPSLAPVPALAPSPTPVAAPSVPSTQAPLTPSLLQLEAAELAKVKNLLESGRAPAALALLEQSSRRFPRGALVQEREILMIAALVRGGDQATARKRARVFLARYPRSLLADRIRAILGEGE